MNTSEVLGSVVSLQENLGKYFAFLIKLLNDKRKA